MFRHRGDRKHEEGASAEESTAPARLRGLVDRGHERVTDLGRRIEDSREQHAGIDIALSFGSHDRQVGGGLLAAAIAFRLFLWLLPFALVVVGVLGFFSHEAAHKQAQKLGLAGWTVNAVDQATRQTNQARWIILLLGIVLLFYASITLGKAIVAAVALVWRVPIDRRGNPLRIGLVTAGTIFVAILLAILGDSLRHGSVLRYAAALIVLTLLWSLLWLAAELMLPRRPGAGSEWLLPGALLVGVGSQVLHIFTVVYLGHRIDSASRLYGALGGAATVLLWAYFIARLVLASAAVNATVHSRSSS